MSMQAARGIAVCILLILLGGCSAGRVSTRLQAQTETDASPQAAETPGAELNQPAVGKLGQPPVAQLPALPAPANLLKQPAAFPATTTDTAYGRTRSGAAFDADLPHNRVGAEGSSAMFYPGDPSLPGGLADVAYCTYRFQIAPFLRMDALKLDWTSHPAPAGNYWVGISDFETGRWRWFDGPLEGQLLEGAALDDMDDPGNGTLFVVVAVVSPGTPELANLEITGPGWAHTWSLEGAGWFDSRAALDDDGSLCLVSTFRDRLVAIKMSGEHEILWANELEIMPGDNPNYSTDLAIDGAGALYTSSVISIPGSNSFQGLLVKLGPDGALIWKRQIDLAYEADTTSLGITRIIVTRNYLYLLLSGSALSSQPYLYNLHYALACMTTDGEWLWIKEFKAPGDDHLAIYGLAKVGDGLVLIGEAHKFTQGVGGDRDGVFVMQTDLAGNISGQKRFVSSETDVSGDCAAADDSGNLFISGNFGSRGAPNKLLVMKLDNDLQITNCIDWSGRLVEHRPYSLSFAAGKLISHNEGYINEWDDQGFSTRKFSLLEFDPDLNLARAVSWNDESKKWQLAQTAFLDAQGNVYISASRWNMLAGWWHSYDDDSEPVELTADSFEAYAERFEIAEVERATSYGPVQGLAEDQTADESALIIIKSNPEDSEAILPTPWYD